MERGRGKASTLMRKEVCMVCRGRAGIYARPRMGVATGDRGALMLAVGK
jgi:hypothetical protein